MVFQSGAAQAAAVALPAGLYQHQLGLQHALVQGITLCLSNKKQTMTLSQIGLVKIDMKFT